jgi:hypothetical protein
VETLDQCLQVFCMQDDFTCSLHTCEFLPVSPLRPISRFLVSLSVLQSHGVDRGAKDETRSRVFKRKTMGKTCFVSTATT